MPNGMRWVGLDVHANASIVAVFDDVRGEVITPRASGRPLEVLDVLHPLARPLRAVYEAGTTGYGLVRRAPAEGIEMAVCWPGNIDRRGGDRVKTASATRSGSRGCSPPAICGWSGSPVKSKNSCVTACAVSHVRRHVVLGSAVDTSVPTGRRLLAKRTDPCGHSALSPAPCRHLGSCGLTRLKPPG